MAHSEGLKHYTIGINEKQLATILVALWALPKGAQGQQGTWGDPHSIAKLLETVTEESPCYTQIGDIF